VAIHSNGQTIFSLSHIEGITLGAGEEIDEVAGRASSKSCWTVHVLQYLPPNTLLPSSTSVPIHIKKRGKILNTGKQRSSLQSNRHVRIG
jgi:hypothetical protein